MARMRNIAKERGLLALVQPVIQSARKVTSCSAVVNVRENFKCCTLQIMAEPRKVSEEASPSPEPLPKQPELHPSDFERLADLVATKLRQNSAGEWLLPASSYAVSSVLLLFAARRGEDICYVFVSAELNGTHFPSSALSGARPLSFSGSCVVPII